MKITNEVQLWKDNNLDRCVMTFSCGGDSMNETEFVLFNNDNEVVVVPELTDYFENEVYNEVDFYEVSDGHYMGEFGEVVITFEEDEEMENGGYFSYYKDAKSEWEESLTEDFKIELSDEELKFVAEKVSNMNGSDWDGEPNVNYKIDCIVTDEEEDVIQKLLTRIDEEAHDYSFENGEGEEQDEGSWNTGDEEELELEDNLLTIYVTRRFYQTQPSED